MANIKSSMKRVQIGRVRNERNKANRTALRSILKKFDAAVAAGNREEAVSTYKDAVKTVDRAVSKGLLHKNNAAHKKSRMAIKVNSFS